MKKMMFFLLAGLLVCPTFVSALPYDTIEMTLSHGTDTHYVAFPGDTTRNYYTDYEGTYTLDGTLHEDVEIFCVENADWQPSNTEYSLLGLTDIDTGIRKKYLQATWLANQYATGEATKEAAQLAIWETIIGIDMD